MKKIYITDKSQIKKYYYLEPLIPQKDIEVYAEVNDKNLIKLKDLGYKIVKLQFGDDIVKKFFFDGFGFFLLKEKQ